MATVAEPHSNQTPPVAPALQGEPGVRTAPRTVFNWAVATWLILLHLGALAAPFVFTWEAIVLTFILHWMTGSIGICLGFHRLLTHTSFRTSAPVRYLLATIGGLAGEGGAIDWVATHRKHHALSDQEGDPHSPRDGGIWSHMLWLGYSIYGRNQVDYTQRWAPDLCKDKGMRVLNWLAIPLHFVLGGLLLAAGYLYGGWFMAASFVMWGIFARLVLVLHSTWFVNSASHIWGYRNYETTDDSRNCWWVALIAYGEGWHNNHHAYPRMANHGHRWWELDMTYWVIRAMRSVGLVWDVVDYKQKQKDA